MSAFDRAVNEELEGIERATAGPRIEPANKERVIPRADPVESETEPCDDSCTTCEVVTVTQTKPLNESADSTSEGKPTIRQPASIDEVISSLVYRVKLPLVLEVALSIPGNWFGLAPCLVVCPPLISSLTNPRASIFCIYHLIQLCILIFFVVKWVQGINGDFKTLVAFGKKRFYLLSPYVAVPLVYGFCDSQRGRSRAVYSLFLWYPTLLATLWLKEAAARTRPCTKFPQYMEQKHYTVIPEYLHKYCSLESFPSGDAASAMVFAIPLVPDRLEVGVLFVMLSCLGRMYFLAHHLSDTLAGVIVTYCVHLLFQQCGLTMDSMRFFYPTLAQLFFVSVSKVILKH